MTPRRGLVLVALGLLASAHSAAAQNPVTCASGSKFATAFASATTVTVASSSDLNTALAALASGSTPTIVTLTTEPIFNLTAAYTLAPDVCIQGDGLQDYAIRAFPTGRHFIKNAGVLQVVGGGGGRTVTLLGGGGQAGPSQGGVYLNGNGVQGAFHKVVFDGNTALGPPNGGALQVDGAYAFIGPHVLFTNNIAPFGNAIYGTNSALIEAGNGVQFINNVAAGGNLAFGGALYLTSDAKMTIGNNLQAMGNLQALGGFAYLASNTALTVGDNATFMNNTAAFGQGGVVYIQSGPSNATLGNNSTFLMNKSGAPGGVISAVLGSRVVIGSDNVFSDNDSGVSGSGGAIYAQGYLGLGDRNIFLRNKGINGAAITTDTGATGSIGSGNVFDGHTNNYPGSTMSLFGTFTVGSNNVFRNGRSTAAMGGCVILGFGGRFTIGAGTRFENCSTTGNAMQGGAVFVQTSAIVTFGPDTAFVNNLAQSQGGALYMMGPSNVTFGDRTIFDGNVLAAPTTGGSAFFLASSSATLSLGADGQIINNSGGAAMYVNSASTLIMGGNTLIQNNGGLDATIANAITYCQPQPLAEQFWWLTAQCGAAPCDLNYTQPAAHPYACALEAVNPGAYGKAADGVVCQAEIPLATPLVDPTPDTCWAACKAQLAPSNHFFYFNLYSPSLGAPRTCTCNRDCATFRTVAGAQVFGSCITGVTLQAKSLPRSASSSGAGSKRLLTNKGMPTIARMKVLKVTVVVSARPVKGVKPTAFPNVGFALPLPDEVYFIKGSVSPNPGKASAIGVGPGGGAVVVQHADFTKRRRFSVALRVAAPAGTVLTLQPYLYQEGVANQGERYTPYCLRPANNLTIAVKANPLDAKTGGKMM